MAVNDRLQLQATKIADSGAGLAICDGTQHYVSDLLPGEQAICRVVHRSQHRAQAWAEIVERQGPPSRDRVSPTCTAFGACGGCAWQHLAYEAQLAAKQQRVADALGVPTPPIVPAPAQLGYRNTGKYVIGPGGILGAYAPRSHRLVDTSACTLVEPAVAELVQAIRQQLAPVLAAGDLQIYDEHTRTGHLRYVVVRVSNTGQTIVGLVTTSTTPAGPVTALAASLPATSVVHVINDALSGVILTRDIHTLAGTDTISHNLGCVVTTIGISEFIQINHRQADELYRTVTAFYRGAPPTRVLDLYCGIGGLSFAFAALGADVTGLERTPAAVRAAQVAANDAPWQVSFRVGDAEAASLDNYDLVSVNPPRRGLDAGLCARLCEEGPARLLYVSCGPMTLARDLVQLRAAGYRIDDIRLFDLMPGTAQVETVVALVR